MGNISSRPDEGAPIYLRDQQRCRYPDPGLTAATKGSSKLVSISSISVFNSKQRALLHVVPDAFPAHRALAKRDPIDESPIEFIQVMLSRGPASEGALTPPGHGKLSRVLVSGFPPTTGQQRRAQLRLHVCCTAGAIA